MKSKRFVAFIIDMAIAVILAIFVYVTLCCFNIKNFSFIGAPFTWVLLFCKDCFNGMSVGKRFVGIQIIDSTNMEIASPAKCVIRNLFYFLGVIDVLVMFFHSKTMRLGDCIARTEVHLRDDTLQKVKLYKIILAIGSVLIVFTIVETLLHVYASSLGLFGLLYR